MRSFFGIISLLIALFSGGCSLAAIDWIDLHNSEDLMMVFTFGVIPMLLSGLLAWVLLHNRPAP